MKIRTGFVSNSSSSSFVVVGIKISRNDLDYETVERQFSEYHVGYVDDWGTEPNSVLIGEHTSAEVSSEEYIIDDIINVTTKLKTLAIENGYNEDEIKLGVFLGTESC